MSARRPLLPALLAAILALIVMPPPAIADQKPVADGEASTLAPASGPVAPPPLASDIWPKGPVRYIIPFGQGGESSIAAELQTRPFRILTGQGLVLLYRPGGGGAVVWSEVAKMPADGSVIIGVNLPHIVLQPARGAGYSRDDLDVVNIFHYTPDALVVAEDSPYDTLQELIADARNRPGEIVFSGSGYGTANHLAQVRFDRIANVKTGYRAYKGTGASTAALLAGDVAAAWGYTTVAGAHKRNVRTLAIATEERHPKFPDVPTFRELGLPIVGRAYRGIAVPRGTPEAVRERISKVFAEINDNPAYVKASQELGFVLVDIGLEKIPAFLEEQSEDYLGAGREAGLLD